MKGGGSKTESGLPRPGNSNIMPLGKTRHWQQPPATLSPGPTPPSESWRNESESGGLRSRISESTPVVAGRGRANTLPAWMKNSSAASGGLTASSPSPSTAETTVGSTTRSRSPSDKQLSDRAKSPSPTRRKSRSRSRDREDRGARKDDQAVWKRKSRDDYETGKSWKDDHHHSSTSKWQRTNDSAADKWQQQGSKWKNDSSSSSWGGSGGWNRQSRYQDDSKTGHDADPQQQEQLSQQLRQTAQMAAANVQQQQQRLTGTWTLNPVAVATPAIPATLSNPQQQQAAFTSAQQAWLKAQSTPEFQAYYANIVATYGKEYSDAYLQYYFNQMVQSGAVVATTAPTGASTASSVPYQPRQPQ
jgi:hypothetical protein